MMATNSTTFRASSLSLIEQEDALRLKGRFDAYRAEGGTQAGFAKEFKMPGGASVITQHVKAQRPISTGQAKAYMRGFGCTLREVSRTLADEAPRDAAPLADKLQRQVYSFANVIAAIPEDSRGDACAEAMIVLSGYLPGAHRAPNPEQRPPDQAKKPPE